MAHERMKVIQSPEEIPKFRSEAEEAEFWANHSLGDWFFEEADSVSESILPPARSQTSPLSELLDDATLGRLKELAFRRSVEPRNLATKFIVDRLDVEEKGEAWPTPARTSP